MKLDENAVFAYARPVWQEGRQDEMNCNLLLRAVLPEARRAVLCIAGHTRFAVYLNRQFIAAGPARAAHGFFRVDEYSLDGLLTEKENLLVVWVAGYNVNSFAYLDGPAFVCCEVTADGQLLAATGVGDAFSCVRFDERVRKVQRYSFQRPFVESYRLGEECRGMFLDPAMRGDTVPLVEEKPRRFLARGVPYPEYDFAPACESTERGRVYDAPPAKPYADRAVYGINEQLRGFEPEQLEELTVAEAEKWHGDHADTAVLPGCDADLAERGYVTFRLPSNLTGFLEMSVVAEEDLTLLVTFDEILHDGEVDFTRLGCSNVVVWHLKRGAYTLRSFEPYTLQYLNCIALGGAVRLRGVGLRRFDYPESRIHGRVAMPTPSLQKIYDAAVETFRQNTLDIYMDCPSRERAGWLCDSFFTSRVEYALTGRSSVERCFLQNFLLPESFERLPAGMLPMCYPSDHYDGVFIPNWAMWFVLELKEYLARSGDSALVEQARARVYDLLAYFRRFENADGLLEKLESWVFLEWSRSNELVQDISYPTNMLYACMKEAVAALYDDTALAAQAAELKEVIRRQSFMGDFFCDNAVYDADGRAVLSGEATESCQYYAFFTGTATPETHPQLWRTLVESFGPHRAERGLFPQVAQANAFIGNYLRLELLYRAGMYDKVTENIEGYFYYMAKRTGTLWEMMSENASCDHGFASHVIYWLNGIYGNA